MTFLKLKSMDLTSYAKNFLSYSVDKHKIYFHRFTDNQLNIYKKDVLFEAMSLSAAGVYIEFVTNANKLTIKVKKESSMKLALIGLKNMGLRTILKDVIEAQKTIKKYGGKPSIREGFDLMVDDKIVDFHHVKAGKIKFKGFNKDRKNITVRIYLPKYFKVGLKHIKLDGSVMNKTEHKRQVLCLGDSITQGFNTKHPSKSYVALLETKLNVKAYNHGVGGYYYNYETLVDYEHLKNLDLITVAYGTNDFGIFNDLQKIKENIHLYYKRFNQLFKGTKTYVISPIWRADLDESDTLDQIREFIKKEVSQYDYITYICGKQLIKNETMYYDDGYLHPNDGGFHQMANGIFKIISEENT